MTASAVELARTQLPSGSRKAIQPTSEPVLQVGTGSLEFALAHIETMICDLMASVRALVSEASTSLAELVRREFNRKRLKLGAPIPMMMAAMVSTTISSMRVNPPFLRFMGRHAARPAGARGGALT